MAMKKEDLRIGNIVSCFYKNKKVVEAIKSIWYDSKEKLYKVEFESGHFGSTNGVSISAIMPILINTKMLENIEFKLIEDYLYLGEFTLNYHKDGFMICVNENDRHITKPISYVHELQNLYHALTGKELKIEMEWL